MMDEQRLKDAENSIGLIDCPDCEQGRVSREGTFEDGQEYERCETCDGSGMVSRFPDGHALIAEVRRLQQEAILVAANYVHQEHALRDRAERAEAALTVEREKHDEAAYNDAMAAVAHLTQQRDAALADLAKLRAAVEALHDYETTGAPDYHEWDRYFDAVYAAARARSCGRPPMPLDASVAMLRTVERWLTVLESDADEIDVVTHSEMLSQVREVLSQFQAVRS